MPQSKEKHAPYSSQAMKTGVNMQFGYLVMEADPFRTMV